MTKYLKITKRKTKIPKIKCAICRTKINKIYGNQVTCTKKECRRTYQDVVSDVERYKLRLLKKAREEYKSNT